MNSRSAARLRERAAKAVIKKACAAAEAVEAYTRACIACADGTGPSGPDDDRYALVRRLREYSAFLERKYGAPA
jgi:hypothetical protein